MAMGRTVIANNVDGSREVVQDGKNGLLIEPDDLENNLVAAIKTLAINPQLRQSLASGAVMTTSEKYSAEVMTHKIEELYIRILSQKN